MATKIVLQSQIKNFSSIIQNLVGFSDYIRMSITSDACLMDTVNDSRTSLCKIKLSSGWFTEYVVESAVTLIINTSILYKIIHVLDDNYPIVLVIHTNELVIQGRSIQSEVTYTIPSHVIDLPEIDVPDNIEYAVDISMSSKTLCSILEHLMIIGEDCKLLIEEDKMKFSSKGDYGTTDINLTIEELDAYAVEENIQLQLEFQLKMLHVVSLFHKISGLTEIHVSKDSPLVIQYNMVDGSYIRFMIAPKISDD